VGDEEEVRLARGAAERIGLPGGHFWVEGPNDEKVADIHNDFAGHMAAAASLSAVARNFGLPRPDAAGHRVVHGGARHVSAERVDVPLLAELRSLIPFAPLHLPSAIQC